MSKELEARVYKVLEGFIRLMQGIEDRLKRLEEEVNGKGKDS